MARTSGEARVLQALPGLDILPFAHVAVPSLPHSMVDEASLVMLFLEERGFGVGMVIDATYDPADRSAVIIVSWP